MWHRIVNGVWKWTGMRAWHRTVSRQLHGLGGGHVGPPREQGDNIPVMLSPGMVPDEIVEYYGEDLALRLNERDEK